MNIKLNALDLLRADHQRIRDLFVAFRESAGIAEKKEFFHKIRQELEVHAELEETVFYPTFSEDDDLAELVGEALEDHQEMRDIIDEIDDSDEDEDFIDLMDELMDTVERHVEEEEDEFFEEVKTIMTPAELEDLGARLTDARTDLSEAA